jgi:hypothetical protein
MSSPELERARSLLGSFVNARLSSIECGEFELRLRFESGIEFVTHAPWRLIHDGSVALGSGDIGSEADAGPARCLTGLSVLSVSISDIWDTKLLLESNYLIEVLSNSSKYEVWEAHLAEGWVIFMDGVVTIFPPS